MLTTYKWPFVSFVYLIGLSEHLFTNYLLPAGESSTTKASPTLCSRTATEPAYLCFLLRGDERKDPAVRSLELQPVLLLVIITPKLFIFHDNKTKRVPLYPELKLLEIKRLSKEKFFSSGTLLFPLASGSALHASPPPPATSFLLVVILNALRRSMHNYCFSWWSLNLKIAQHQKPEHVSNLNIFLAGDSCRTCMRSQLSHASRFYFPHN